MKTYKNLYQKLYSYKNLEKAFKKASKSKNSLPYVIEFRLNLKENLLQLQKELKNEIYYPHKLTKFTIKDPKTRLIRKSIFRDRVIHHAIVNILEPIYDPIFIADSYANRLGKGTIGAILKCDKFKRKVSKNGQILSHAVTNNMIKGYVLKADIKKFFDSVDQNKLIEIFKRKIKDDKLIWLITKILKNFDHKRIGMPLGNMTSQFFANVYLNELDYFVKHKLKAKYYIRYVDDFVILHSSKQQLRIWEKEIEIFLKESLKLEIHPDKSKIINLSKGIDFVGFRNFYYYKLLRKRNMRKVSYNVKQFKKGELDEEKFKKSLEGWRAYAKWANSYNFYKELSEEVDMI